MRFLKRTFNLARLAQAIIFLGTFASLLVFIWLVAQPTPPMATLVAFPGAAYFCVLANAKYKKATGEDLF